MALFAAEISRSLLKCSSLQKSQKAFRYVVLLPQVPECTPDDNEILRIVKNGDLPAYDKNISFKDAMDGAAKLALEYEPYFYDHCQKVSDVHLEKTFSTVLEPLNRRQAEMDYAWGTLRHVYTITDHGSPEAAVNAKIRLKGIRKLLSRTLASQYDNAAFYRAVKEVAADKDFLNNWQRRLCDKYLIEGKLNGVEVGKQKIIDKLGFFRQKLNMDIGNFWINVEQTSVEPANFIKNADAVAEAPHCVRYEWAVDKNRYLKGPYYVTMSNSSYIDFLKYCRERLMRFREFVYWNNRAAGSEQVHLVNNSNNIENIRLGRDDEAKGLGFKTFADMSLLTKMAYTLDELEQFLVTLSDKCKTKFANRLESMQAYAKQIEMVADPLKPWDYYYYSRKLIESAVRFDSAQFSGCFPFKTTWKNLLTLTERLFSIQYVDISESVPRWHDTVKVYSVRDAETGQEKGILYFDSHVRTNKVPSNWVTPGRNASQFENYKPIVYLNVNVMKDDRFEAVPMSLELLLFLAESLGDALLNILSDSPYSVLGGSQSFESDGEKITANVLKWLTLEPTILNFLSNGALSLSEADVPREVYIESSLPVLLRECLLSEYDLVIHNSDIWWRDIYKDLHKRYYGKPNEKMDNFPCSFTEIMCEQYAASYYGFLWAEMVACDIVAAFKEAGIGNNDALSAVGKRYREIFLSKNGSTKLRDLFKEFRGRDLEFQHMFGMYKLN